MALHQKRSKIQTYQSFKVYFEIGGVCGCSFGCVDLTEQVPSTALKSVS
jgi:hypothetical protein